MQRINKPASIALHHQVWEHDGFLLKTATTQRYSGHFLLIVISAQQRRDLVYVRDDNRVLSCCFLCIHLSAQMITIMSHAGSQTHKNTLLLLCRDHLEFILQHISHLGLSFKKHVFGCL